MRKCKIVKHIRWGYKKFCADIRNFVLNMEGVVLYGVARIEALCAPRMGDNSSDYWCGYRGDNALCEALRGGFAPCQSMK